MRRLALDNLDRFLSTLCNLSQHRPGSTGSLTNSSALYLALQVKPLTPCRALAPAPAPAAPCWTTTQFPNPATLRNCCTCVVSFASQSEAIGGGGDGDGLRGKSQPGVAQQHRRRHQEEDRASESDSESECWTHHKAPVTGGSTCAASVGGELGCDLLVPCSRRSPISVLRHSRCNKVLSPSVRANLCGHLPASIDAPISIKDEVVSSSAHA